MNRWTRMILLMSAVSVALSPAPGCHDIDPFSLNEDHTRESGGLGGTDGMGAAGAAGKSSLPECSPQTVKCVDTRNSKECGDDGKWGEIRPCPLACSGNACVGACVPDDTQCRNTRELRTCRGDGEWEASTCPAACSQDRCTGICVPGTRRCVTADGAPISEGARSQVCDLTGQWGEAVDCIDGCRNATCHGQCSESSADFCTREGETELALRCDQGEWTRVECPFVCSVGECVGSCKPGAERCHPEGPLERCDDDGTWTQASCPAGQACVKDGVCMAPPTVLTFTADPPNQRPGTEVLLQWTLGGGLAEKITIEPDVGVLIDSSSQRSLSFTPERSGKYTLRVENAAGSGSRSLVVQLSPGGQFDRLHRFGAAGFALALALSPSGRVASLVQSAGSFTVGPVSATTDDVYVAEHDLEQNSVLRIQTPEYVLAGRDLAFDREELLVTGDARSLAVPRSEPQAVAVVRLDANLQTVDSSVYSQDASDFGVRILLGPEREVFVLAYSSQSVSTSLVELDADLSPVEDNPMNFATNPGRAWQDVAVDPTTTLVGLRPAPSLGLDVVRPQTPVSVTPVEWPFGDDPGQVNAIATYSTGNFIIVGYLGDKGYLQLLSLPATLTRGETNFYPPSSDVYDSLVFHHVCVDSAGRILVVGDVTIDGQSDIFVHAFSVNGFTEEWDAPLIWGSPDFDEWGVRIACDPRGYALVLGKEMRQSGEVGPLILRVK